MFATIYTTTTSEQGVPLVSGDLGIILNIDGKEKTIPIGKLTEIDLDAEVMEEATKVRVGYDGEVYELDLPEKDSTDWNDLVNLVDPV